MYFERFSRGYIMSIIVGEEKHILMEKDICIHMSEGIQKIIPPEHVRKILDLIVKNFNSNYKAIFITTTVQGIHEKDNILFLPVSVIDKLFFHNIIATKVETEKHSKKIIHVRLAIEK